MGIINPNVYLSSTLIKNIKLRGLIPTNQQTYLDDDFIALINTELFGTIVPMIMAYQEEFYVTSIDIPTVAGVSTYAIPDDAAGMKIRAVSSVTPSGYTYSLPRYTLDQLAGVDHSAHGQAGFYMQGNNMVVYPTPSDTSTTLRVFYYKRPNRVVKPTQAAQVLLVDSITKIITVTNAPSGWIFNTDVHSVAGTPMFDDTSATLSVIANSGTDLEVNSVAGVKVGDYMCLKGESPFAHIPTEGYPLLEQAVVVKVLEGLGDREGMQAAQVKLTELEKKFAYYVSPRVDGNPKKITNRNSIFKFTRR